jgi:hypothetical protein
MHTVITKNNAYDTILLVDDNDTVLSRWDVEPVTLRDYISITDASEWEAGFWPAGFAPEQQDTEEAQNEMRTIAAYGEEYGRDGKINDDERAEFWQICGRQ